MSAWLVLVTSAAMELSAVAGSSRIVKNDLLEADEGAGQELALRAALRLPGCEPLSLGLTGGAVRFQIAADDAAGETTIARDGYFQGYVGGLQLRLEPPRWYVRPFLRFAAVAGRYEYDVDAVSQSGGHETRAFTDVTLATSGLEAGLGLSFGETLGVSAEYKETREIMEVQSVSFSHASTLDGVAQPIDANDRQVEEELQTLVGKRYGNATRAFLFGMFWSF